MWRRPTSRVTARLRRSLGHDAAMARIDALEARLAALEGPRFPNGPVYLGDHQALVATRWGGKLVADTRDSLLAPWLLLDGLWESHMTGWMHDVLRPGDTFVDVGANIGYYTVLAGLRVGPAGRVVAVEAHPGLAAILRRNVTINGIHGRTTVWERAAWSEPARLQFHLRVHYSANSSVAATGADALDRLADEEETVEVEAATVDSLLAGVDRVDVVKVDVEGAEIHAFSGLSATMDRNPAMAVMFEWSPEQVRQVGGAPEALIDLLAGHGFGFRLLEEDLKAVDRSRLLDLSYGNVLAQR